MSLDKRNFPRIPINLQINFEFVKWNERHLDRSKSAFVASTFDISVFGIGVNELPEINERLLKQLQTGKKKIRLKVSLIPDHDPVYTFARLVWYQQVGVEEVGSMRYGFEFIDIPDSTFKEIKTFVDAASSKDKRLFYM